MRNALIPLVACAMAIVSGDAAACGESLFRVGKGLTYRAYTAPIPGKILIVAKTDNELAMVERLIAAGHDLHVVSDPEQIAENMQQESFDIVMTLYSQHETVESEIAGSNVMYIPVAQHDSGEESEAKAAYDLSLATDDSVKKFLKTIHKALKEG